MILIILALSPIFHMYRFFSVVTFGEVVLSICTVVVIMHKDNLCIIENNSCIKSSTLMIIYYLVITFIGTGVYGGKLGNNLKEIGVFVLYYIIAFTITDKFNTQSFLEIYKCIGVATSVFMCLQYLAYSTLHVYLPGLIPGLTSWAGNSTSYYISQNGGRMAAFFTEPSFAAMYLGMPFIYSISMLARKNKYLDFSVVVIAIALILSYSGTGVVVLLVGAYVYIRRVIEFSLRRMQKNKFFIGLLLCVAMMIVIRYLYTIPKINRLFLRIGEISGNGTMKSGYIRMRRGFEAYANLPFIAKLFGIGFGNYEILVKDLLRSSINNITDLVLTWLNDAQTYLINGGVIGVLLYIRFLSKGIKWKKSLQKDLFLLFVLIHFFSSMLTMPIWVIFIFVMFSNGIFEE